MMKPLPQNPNIDQLKRQAKELRAAFARHNPEAMQRVERALPAARNMPQDAVRAFDLKLHDAQSCIAREYGLPSWDALRSFTEIARTRAADRNTQMREFARYAFGGDLVGDMYNPNTVKAAQVLQILLERGTPEPWIACACGDVDTVRRCLKDKNWIREPLGPFKLPPLIAATHSSLLKDPRYTANIRRVVTELLNAGADPNQFIESRWPPASLEAPDPRYPLSALYGAAGKAFDAVVVQDLLEAGANPNDGESLYHALESHECTSLLLQAGASVHGTNALLRCLDFDQLSTFELLLPHVTDPAELNRALLWAIRRRRDAEHINALVDAGADANARSEEGISALIQAMRYGLGDVAESLRAAGATAQADPRETLIAACARGDLQAAKAILRDSDNVLSQLSEPQMRMLPEMAAAGATSAVRTMVEIGWPIDVKGGDWNATALNHAIFSGHPELTQFLLERGADWRQEHGFGDNACGTLSWASINRPVADGNWVGCAQALVDNGLTSVTLTINDPGSVHIEGVRYVFSEEVTDCLLDAQSHS